MLRRARRLLQMLGLTALCAIAAAAIVALWQYIINTPQPLESILPGDTRIYRWKQGHIFYKVLGTTDAPPLVLLHAPGVGASSYEMRQIMQPLAQHYRVYAPDLLGFGLSDRPRKDYSAETYISLCHDFLAEVVGGPATILANGLSCNYAVAVAARSPHLCTGLVLISPTAALAVQQGRKQWGLLRELVTLPALGSLLYPLVSTRPALRYVIKRRHSDCTMSELDYLYATTHQLGAQYAPLALIAGKLAYDVSEQIDGLEQPTLIVWGTGALNDTRSIPSHLPRRTLVILLQDSGTYVHEERPETVVANIEEWSKAGKVAIAVASKSVGGTNEAVVSNPPATQDDVVELASTPTAETNEAVVSSPPATQDDVVELASTPTAETGEAVVSSAPTAQEDVVELASTPTAETGEAVVSSAPATQEDKEGPAGVLEVEAYCVKCKKKVAMQDPREVTMKNGRPALRGTCPVCGTGLFRIGRI